MKDYKPETRDLISRLINAGFFIVEGTNGGEEWVPYHDLESFVAEMTATDEATIVVRPPGAERRRLGIRIVLGNEPGYLVNDYHIHPQLDELLLAHADRWEGKPQPMKP